MSLRAEPCRAAASAQPPTGLEAKGGPSSKRNPFPAPPKALPKRVGAGLLVATRYGSQTTVALRDWLSAVT